MFATDTEVRLDKVLVIIPTYNEAENVETIVARTRRANPKVDVLVADDNSPDGTGEIADRLASAGYDVLVEMDADGSHQPEQLPLLLEALKHADMVKGSRYVKGGSVVNWPKYRELISRGGGLWTRMCLGIGVKDPTGGFNAFRANTLRTIGLDEVASAGYCFQLDLTWRTLKKGMTVAEVPIEFIEREYGNSKMSKEIVVEALLRTTLWGIDYRSHQLKDLGHVALERAEQVAGDIKDRRLKR